MSETMPTSVERPPARKPLLKKRPTGKFKQREFQTEDIAYMDSIPDGSANWSEMGSFKTSTAEWLIELKTKHIPNPRVLIIPLRLVRGRIWNPCGKSCLSGTSM